MIAIAELCRTPQLTKNKRFFAKDYHRSWRSSSVLKKQLRAKYNTRHSS